MVRSPSFDNGASLVHSPLSFYILRFFLGIAEAGLVPGMLLYVSFFKTCQRATYRGTPRLRPGTYSPLEIGDDLVGNARVDVRSRCCVRGHDSTREGKRVSAPNIASLCRDLLVSESEATSSRG